MTGMSRVLKSPTKAARVRMQLRTNRNKTVLREAHDRMSHSCPDNSAALHGVPLGGLTRGDKARIIALDEAAVITSLAPGELERRLIEMGLIVKP